jgi:dolichol-phosphate mannosyltransferase
VVIPVYNAEGTLLSLYDRLVSAVTPLTADFEIVFVDDGSADGSWPIIRDLASRDSRVQGLRLSRNFGQHHAIGAGLDVCQGSWVVVMDCDLQDAPEEIPRLYACALEGNDVVLARRAQRRDAWLRRSASWVFYRLFSYLTEIRWDSRVGAFRILSRKVVEELRMMREQLRFLAGLVDWLGFPTAVVEVQHATRQSGRSSYSWRKLIRLGGHAVIAHTNKPLRLVIRLGFAISALAFVAGAFLVVRFLVYGNQLAGWNSVIIAVAFLSGLNITILGVLGVYLGKVFDEVKRRPLYVVREASNLAARPRTAEFRITDSRFDSGVLADRVGVVEGDDADASSPPDELLASARQAGYQLLLHQSPVPRNWPEALYLGATEEYEGTIQSIRTVPGGAVHFSIAPAGSWKQIEPLLAFAAPTRFTGDPRLSPETVRRHKRLNLETRAGDPPAYTVIATSRSGVPLGFQCSYVCGDRFVLYELMIRPQALAGVLATELLLYNLATLRRQQPTVTKVVTTVYRENHLAVDFFTRLGLTSSGRVLHHYHLWL